MSAQLVHTDFERDPGPGRAFFKDHPQGLPFEQLVRCPLLLLVLQFSGQGKERLQILKGPVGQG